MRHVDRILVIKGEGQYGQIRSALDEMIKGFSKKGCLVTILDLIYDEGEHLRLKEDWLGQYDLIFSMNLIGYELYISSTFDNNPVFWGYLEDHPYYHHSRIAKMKGDCIISCCDKRHVGYVERFYPNIPWTCFMPHGGLVGNAYNKSFNDRSMDFVFIGSLDREDELLKVLNETEKRYGDNLHYVLEASLSDINIILEDFVEAMIVHTSDYNIGQFPYIMNDFSVIDAYRRFKKRRNLLEMLAQAGISVYIFGNGWEQLSDEAKRIHHLMGSVVHSQIGNVMGDSRFIINDMPLFTEGTHDRVFAAMQSGAVCVTDESVVLKEIFCNMEDVVFYDANHINELPPVLYELMNDSEKADRIARAGYEAAKGLTWENCAKDIVEIVESL